MTADRKQHIANAFGQVLRDFGYDDYTNEQVEVDIALALQDKAGDSITASFIQCWLVGDYAHLRLECEELFGGGDK